MGEGYDGGEIEIAGTVISILPLSAIDGAIDGMEEAIPNACGKM